MDGAWFDKAAAHLEWDRLVLAVRARCRGETARRNGLTCARTREQAALMLRETAELLGLLERGDRLPLDDLRDIDPHLARLERDGVLQASALSDVLVTLKNARGLRTFLAGQRVQLAVLHASCATDPALDDLQELLEDALEPDGTLADRASPELRSLRTEIANLRERIVGRLREVIERFADVLSDQYYTVREGRYVLPVRRDAHERVPGIVHATSQSGSSVFVEPRSVLAHGNRLKLAESELEREEQRVLAALSEQVREQLPSLRAAAEALARIDLRHASARLGRDLQGVIPELAAGSELLVRGARHPLLVLDGVAAVPNDLELSAGQGLVISGPNASGKTVLLKTLGLCALMARHGLPIAAAPGSRVGYFERVLTDVGDEQSTARNLSTFSAHITNLTTILAQAGGDALALLDELATGTDPEQGAALACGIIDALCQRQAAFAVTTHYEPVKAFAMRDSRLRTASVGFDVERMEPTFGVTHGVPGASNALIVARRFGLPEAVIEFAERVLPEQARDFERLLRELDVRVRALDEEQKELAGLRASLSALRAEEQTRVARLRREGDAQVARETAELVQEVRSARGEVERARAQLKAEALSKAEFAAAERNVDRVAGRVALGGDLVREPAKSEAAPSERQPIAEGALRPGARIYVPRLRSEAVVLEEPSKGRVRVAVGPLKLWVETEGLGAAAPERRAPAPSPPPAQLPAPGRTVDNTLNLKGMRVDDALSMMESFIDRLYTTDARVGYVLHGHGTGALREAVRKHLQEAGLPNVHASRPGELEEGGDAVTVFYLTP